MNPAAALMKKYTKGANMYLIVDITNIYLRKEDDLFTLPWRQRPSVVRSDCESAHKELQRLAWENPGKKFVLFEAVFAASDLNYGGIGKIIPNGCEDVAKRHPAKKKKKRIKTLEKA